MSAESGPSVDVAVERAEQMVDASLATLGGWISRVQAEVLKSVALAREEADDVMAEARYMARGDKGR